MSEVIVVDKGASPVVVEVRQGIKGDKGDTGVGYSDYTGIPKVADLITKGPHTDIRAYGAIGNGVNNDTTAITAALTSGASIFTFPQGTYLIDNISIPNGTVIEGAGMGKTVIKFTNTTAGITTSAEARKIVIRNLTVQSNSSQGIGIKLTQARHCHLENVEVLDSYKGIVLDGSSTWCASNILINPVIGNCSYGLTLTADSGKQTNHTVVLGGYIYGSTGIKNTTGSTGILVERGDTNYFYGTAVETFDIGVDFEATDSGGNVAFAARVEDCNTKYKMNSSIANNLIFAPTDITLTVPGSGDGAAIFSVEPTFRLTNTYLPNNKGIKFKGTGGDKQELVRVSNSDNLELLTPNFGTSNAVKILSRSDLSQLASFAKGVITLNQLPTSATGLPSGGLWRDAANGNALKVVP